MEEKAQPSLDGTTVALAHWQSDSWGGAAYVATKLAEVLDLDTIYTVGQPEADSSNPYGDVTWVDVTSGAGDALRRRAGRAGEYAIWEDVDWTDFGAPDILLTSGSTTRAVLTPDDVMHVNYCHSPPRWLYDLYHERKTSLVGTLARPALRYFRIRDQTVDSRVDAYLANSPVIQRRLWKYYKREADVLYPPLELDSYDNASDDGYFLHLGRLDSEKGIEAIVAAFEERDDRLVLAGGRGDAADSLLRTIQQAANMEYRGFVDEHEKHDLLARCRAVVFNGIHEDFGIVPIEANASGKPCLVRNDGFPGLFVEEGTNGLVHDGTAAGIEAALDRFSDIDTSETDFERLVEPFSVSVFERRLKSILAEQYEAMQTRFQPPDHDEYRSIK